MEDHHHTASSETANCRRVALSTRVASSLEHSVTDGKAARVLRISWMMAGSVTRVLRVCWHVGSVGTPVMEDGVAGHLPAFHLAVVRSKEIASCLAGRTGWDGKTVPPPHDTLEVNRRYGWPLGYVVEDEAVGSAHAGNLRHHGWLCPPVRSVGFTEAELFPDPRFRCGALRRCLRD